MPSTGGPSGHLRSKHYIDKKGIKVGAGQKVRTGTILTREGNKWKAGKNVGDSGTLYARCEGVIYFTKKKGRLNKRQTLINIMPIETSKGKKSN